MAKNKSILAETLSEVNEIKRVLESQAKHILKSELESLLTESVVSDEIATEEAVAESETVAEEVVDEPENNEEVVEDETVEENVEAVNEGPEDEETAIDDEESGAEEEIPTDDSTDDIGDELPSPDEIDGQDLPGEELPMDVPPVDDIEDLRGMSQEEVLDVFKKMGPEDQVVVVKDGGDIHLSDSDNEYIIKADETPETEVEPEMEPVEPEVEPDAEDDVEDETSEESESIEDEAISEESNETVFEVEINEEESAMVNESDEKTKEQLVMTRKKLAEAVAKSQALNKQLSEVTSVVEEYKKNEGEYRKAIGALKNQLNEVAIFSSNLTYAMKLMTEHSTTKQEKKELLSRFDKVTTLSESQLTYESLVAELSGTRKSAEEQIQQLVEGSESTPGSSKLNESKIYSNPAFDRVKELINKTSR